MKELKFKRKVRGIGGGSVGFSIPVVFLKAGILENGKEYTIRIQLTKLDANIRLK